MSHSAAASSAAVALTAVRGGCNARSSALSCASPNAPSARPAERHSTRHASHPIRRPSQRASRYVTAASVSSSADCGGPETSLVAAAPIAPASVD
eukprot:6214614-Pleurochrysis_carterae.AAC.4